MRVKIARVCGGLVLFGLSTACSGKTESGDPAEHAGSGGALGNAGAGGAAAAGATSTAGATSAGSAGTGDASAGEGGADSGAAGDAGTGGTDVPGNGGASGTPSFGGTGGVVYPPIDIGPQKTSDKLDVLFVVDNSVSMADKQTILSKSVSSFVTRLVNPLCLDGEGNPVATQPASGGANCPSGTREMTPVKDLHLGVITTSIGSHGGFVCSTGSADEHLDDHAQLLPSQRPNLPSFQGTGFLSYDAAGLNGVADATSVITDLKTTIDAATERGCGYEAPLEAMYRFLVDPQPPVSVTLVNNQSTPGAVNQALLDQRHAFLRPDSAVAIVILSDENDCSIRDDSVGWFVGAQSRMPLSTTACATDANDPCCRSCATYETTPRAGCAALSDDANCKLKTSGQSYATWDAAHDSLNLRCFDQQRRFGFDLLYPVERYSDALSNPLVYNRNQELVPNPLLVGDEKGPRSATLISVSMIIGAPWQDLATPASLGSGHAIEYMNGADLESSGRWPLLIGDRAHNVRPSDPFMIESIEERTGQNPLTNIPIVSSVSTNPLANSINGHEQKNSSFDDLQFACIFPLPTPKPCASGDSLCDCSADKMGNTAAITASNTPLCQPPEGGAPTTTQYFGKGYPSTRELTLAKQLGARAVPASICPKTMTDTDSPDYAYKPAFSALRARIATTLK